MSGDQNVAASSSVPAPGEQRSRGVSWAGVFVACALTSMVTIAVNMWLQRDLLAAGAHRYVFLDARRLIDTKALEINARGLAEAESSKEGAAFAESMKQLVADYRAKGYTVLNGAALLSESEESDITLEVAQRLGVDLELKGVIDGGSHGK